MPAAAWTRTARDLTADRDEWKRYLTIEQVSVRTGLEIATIRDNLARPEISNKTVPRSAICRPVARIGMIPMWSKAQVADYDRLVVAAGNATRTTKTPVKLPQVSVAVARGQKLVSILDLAKEIDCAPNTLRRLSRDHGFPEPIALAAREQPGVHGRQHELRSRARVLAWILRYSQDEDGRDRIALPAPLLDELRGYLDAGDLDSQGDATDEVIETRRTVVVELIEQARAQLDARRDRVSA